MANKPQSGATTSSSSSATPASGGGAKRPGDTRDALSELAERAQTISQEASTKVSAAMRDVVNGAAGLAGFAIESVRDMTQYLVRRGQMTPEDGERLIREAEQAHAKRGGKKAGSKSSAKPAKSPSKPAATKSAKPKAKAKKR